MIYIILIFAKLVSRISKLFNLGHGSTWPGHIALKLNKHFIESVLKKSKTKIILITGTNGKTTTSKLLESILLTNNYQVILNSSGANLLNGIASALILNTNLLGRIDADFAIFEVDENALPVVGKIISPDYIIALNLFRDQLDRYGEINTIARKWKETYLKLINTQFILNADDPQIAYLGDNLRQVSYFGVDNPKLGNKEKQHASDSILCPRCSSKLDFEFYYFSHLGKWSCSNCKLSRPKLTKLDHVIYPLSGTYVMYDTHAAILTAKLIGISPNVINKGLKNFIPAFGRQETLKVKNTTFEIFLSKNPTSFNESLRTINQKKAKNILLILNDRIPDGTDVSWIWDIDFEQLINKNLNLYLSGDRVYDLALRLKYAGINLSTNNLFENLDYGIKSILRNTNSDNEIVYILPTYSAMLEIRKILTGKKIL